MTKLSIGEDPSHVFNVGPIEARPVDDFRGRETRFEITLSHPLLSVREPRMKCVIETEIDDPLLDELAVDAPPVRDLLAYCRKGKTLEERDPR